MSIKPQDHPDFVGGIVWSPLEIRWINDAIEAARREGIAASQKYTKVYEMLDDGRMEEIARLHRQLAESQAREAAALKTIEDLCRNGSRLTAHDLELIGLTVETRASGADALQSAIADAARRAMLAEASEWQGDNRWAVFRAFKDVANRLGAVLTIQGCEAESQKARQQ